MTFNSTNIGKIIYSLCNTTIASYPVVAPQSTAAPYLVYNILSNDPEYTKDGASWVDKVTVLLTIYETTYALANSKAASIRTALDNKRGSQGGYTVDSILFITEQDDPYDEELQLYSKTIEFLFRLKNK